MLSPNIDSMRRYWLPGLIVAFIALGVVYATVTPLFEISDELWHYPMVKRLADGDGLPLQDPAQVGPWRQEGSQPPLYYALMALATRWIDTSDMDQVRWLNPHADNGIITADGNNNIVIHTYRERWPWYGTVLAVRLIRFLSVLLGAGTVYFTYRLALELMPGRTGLALAAAGLTGFVPMFLFISGSVNNDNLAICLSALSLWLMARWLNQPPTALTWQHLVAGLALGGAALSKVSTLGLLPLAGLALGYSQVRASAAVAWRQRLRILWQRSIWQFVVVFGTALIVCGWWYWRNYQLYGDWLGWNRFLAIVGNRPYPPSLLQLWGERVGFVQAYWGLFGGVSVPMPGWTYTILDAVAVLAIVGLGWRTWEAFARRRVTLDRMILWLVPIAWIGLIFVGLIRWTSATWASQGRLIFPAISCISVLAAAGLERLWRGLPALVVVFMAVLAAAVPFAVIAPHYAPPPELTAEQRAAISNVRNADFGGEMELLGFDLGHELVLPGGEFRLTLYWQSRIAMDRNWTVFVHLVDDQGIIVAQRDRYPGQGALATTLMPPGRAFADAYVVPVPIGTYAPSTARLEVGLYDANTGERLPLTAGGDALTLASVNIEPRPGNIPNAVKQNFGGIIKLVGYDMDRRTLTPGDTLNLTLYWQGLKPMRTNYSVFAHVRGEGTALWAGADSWPQQGAAPTATWIPGQLLEDHYALKLQTGTPSGVYDVEVGLYDSTTGKRLQLVSTDGRILEADFLYLSKIRVVSP